MVNVGPDTSLGGWVTKVQDALAAMRAEEGGGDPPSPQARRTTGIAAFAHTESKNPPEQAV